MYLCLGNIQGNFLKKTPLKQKSIYQKGFKGNVVKKLSLRGGFLESAAFFKN